MRTQDLKIAHASHQSVAWVRSVYEGGGIAIVYVLNTGVINPGRPRSGRHDHCEVRVDKVAGMSKKMLGLSVDVPCKNLHEIDTTMQDQIALLVDRDQTHEAYEYLAARRGVMLAHIDPIRDTVTLTGGEFERICALLADAEMSEGSDVNVLDASHWPPPEFVQPLMMEEVDSFSEGHEGSF